MISWGLLTFYSKFHLLRGLCRQSSGFLLDGMMKDQSLQKYTKAHVWGFADLKARVQKVPIKQRSAGQDPGPTPEGKLPGPVATTAAT